MLVYNMTEILSAILPVLEVVVADSFLEVLVADSFLGVVETSRKKYF